jgi:tRNA-dihydrouridine synthase
MSGSVSGVLVGRGVLRNVSSRERGEFLLEYIQLLLNDGADEVEGFRHVAPGGGDTGAISAIHPPARGRERWVINKIRALGTWYSKGFDRGSHFRVAVNKAENVEQLRAIVDEFFFDAAAGRVAAPLLAASGA